MEPESENSGLLKSISDLQKISRVSNTSDFLRSFTLNSSLDSFPSAKRKLMDDSDTDCSLPNKESRMGSPLMSPWEFRRLRADLVDSKAQIVRLEDRIDQLHKKNKESVIFFDQEKSAMKVQLDSNRRTIQSLEHKLQRMRTRETEIKSEMLKLKSAQNNARLDKDDRILFLENENEDIICRLNEFEGDTDGRIEQLNSELDTLQAELQQSQLSQMEQQELIESLNSRLAVASKNCREMEELRLELHLAKDKIKEMEHDKDEWEEGRAIMTILQDRVLLVEKIEAELEEKKSEVANLRLAVQNKLLLEERVHDLELKQSIAAGREREFISLKEKNFDLETEVDKWVYLVKSICGSGTREELMKYVADLDEKELSHALDRHALKAEVDAANEMVVTTKNQLDVAKKTEKELKESLERFRTAAQLLRRKSALIARERDSYRQQLDLYENDLTVSGSSGKTSQQDRVQEFESIVEGYRDHISSLEQKLQEYHTDDAEARIEHIRQLTEQIKTLQADNERIMKRRDEVEELLEQKISRGEHLSNTMVLHFKNNPCAQAEAKMGADAADLRRECERLKARVRLLESGEHLDLTTKAAMEVDAGHTVRIQELEEQLESSMLKITRLKEMFKATSQDFRDICYMLLGYRIDLVSNRTYRLTNMYSDNPSDHLMFELTKYGMVKMLETPFTESQSDLVNVHLHENNSFPCFLSAITLSLHANTEHHPYEEDVAIVLSD